MPSIKSCLAAIALAALAFSPVAATPLAADDSLVRRAEPAFYSNEAAVEKRSAESRKEASIRVRKAKIAAAEKAKRTTASVEEGAALLKRHIESMHAEQGVTRRDLQRRAVFARALRRYRCGTDRVCFNAVTSPSDLPANGRAVCNTRTRLCSVGCQTGFVLQGAECIASAPTCGPNTCPTTANGVYLCSGGNVCTLVCDSSNGYVPTAAGTCVNTRLDPDNCGAVGNACPASYNGVGERACRSGICRLTCPFGSTLRRTQDRTGLYCYGL